MKNERSNVRLCIWIWQIVDIGSARVLEIWHGKVCEWTSSQTVNLNGINVRFQVLQSGFWKLWCFYVRYSPESCPGATRVRINGRDRELRVRMFVKGSQGCCPGATRVLMSGHTIKKSPGKNKRISSVQGCSSESENSHLLNWRQDVPMA